MYQYLISLGVGSAGIISALFAFWRKAKIEKENQKLKDANEAKNLAIKGLFSDLEVVKADYKSDLKKFQDEIETLKSQRATALAAIDRCNAPGALRGVLRASLGIPDDGLSKPS
jgi:DNA-binding LacI/PurR family transcriptional regulator